MKRRFVFVMKSILIVTFFGWVALFLSSCTTDDVRLMNIEDHDIMDIIFVKDIDEDILVGYSYLSDKLGVSHGVARIHESEIIYNLSMDDILEDADDTRIIDIMVDELSVKVLLNGRTSSDSKIDILGLIDIEDDGNYAVIMETSMSGINRGYSGYTGIINKNHTYQIVYTKKNEVQDNEVHLLTPGVNQDEFTDEILDIAREQEGNFILIDAYYQQGYYMVYTHRDDQVGYYYDTSIDYIDENQERSIVYTSEHAALWSTHDHDMLVLYMSEIDETLILDPTDFNVLERLVIDNQSVDKRDVIFGHETVYFVNSYVGQETSHQSLYYQYWLGIEGVHLMHQRPKLGEGEIFYHYETRLGTQVSYILLKGRQEAELVMSKIPVD